MQEVALILGRARWELTDVRPSLYLSEEWRHFSRQGQRRRRPVSTTIGRIKASGHALHWWWHLGKLRRRGDAHARPQTDCTRKRLWQRGDNLWRTTRFDNKVMKVAGSTCVHQSVGEGEGWGPPEDVVAWLCIWGGLQKEETSAAAPYSAVLHNASGPSWSASAASVPLKAPANKHYQKKPSPIKSHAAIWQA